MQIKQFTETLNSNLNKKANLKFAGDMSLKKKRLRKKMGEQPKPMNLKVRLHSLRVSAFLLDIVNSQHHHHCEEAQIKPP